MVAFTYSRQLIRKLHTPAFDLASYAQLRCKKRFHGPGGWLCDPRGRPIGLSGFSPIAVLFQLRDCGRLHLCEQPLEHDTVVLWLLLLRIVSHGQTHLVEFSLLREDYASGTRQKLFLGRSKGLWRVRFRAADTLDIGGSCSWGRIWNRRIYRHLRNPKEAMQKGGAKIGTPIRTISRPAARSRLAVAAAPGASINHQLDAAAVILGALLFVISSGARNLTPTTKISQSQGLFQRP